MDALQMGPSFSKVNPLLPQVSDVQYCVFMWGNLLSACCMPGL